MLRENQLKKIAETEKWDILIIGGGASGLGVALDAVSRGLKTLLVEKHDFGKGTSSKSTKLIHGGVRYLQQGNIRLVREALKERDYIIEKAPHNAHLQPFIIPFYSLWMGLFYFTGLKIYDLLAGKRQIGSTKWLSKRDVSQKSPHLNQKGLKGGIMYFDGQFDDARMCIDLVKTIQKEGGVCLNYLEYTEPSYNNNMLEGGKVRDVISGKDYVIKSRYVVNATGVFADSVIKMDNPKATRKIVPSRGSHIVLDRKFIESDHAIMIPKTSDGRVLFAIPWNDKLILGTTDVKTNKPQIEPETTSQEINFILKNAQKYFEVKPEYKDILAVFSGLRPLAAPERGSSKTKEISRGHKILESDSGLISIIGGKWTTFRKMGEDVLNFINKKENGNLKDSSSESIAIYPPDNVQFKKYPLLELNEELIRYMIEDEMACTIEDILARRTRTLILDATKAVSKAKDLAIVMQRILHENDEWMETQVTHFKKLSAKYLIQVI